MILFVAVVATTICCFLCSCCYLYRRRQHLQSPFEGTCVPGKVHQMGRAEPHGGRQRVQGRGNCSSVCFCAHAPPARDPRNKNVPGLYVNSRPHVRGHACT